MAIINKPYPSHGNLVWEVTEAPTTEPITVDEVKAWGKIDTTAEDTVIESLITAIRELAEAWLGRALIEQEITSTLDFWPKEIIKLPRPKLISVSSIVTLNEDDEETAYSSTNYFVRTDVQPGQIVIRNGCTPPINTNRYYGGYKIVHLNGYGDAAADVPQALRQGLIEWTLHALESRITDRDPPDNAMPLLARYQIKKI